MSALVAYHGDAAVKRRTMARVARHRKLDQLVQGVGAEGQGANFRGCAVGCTIGTYDHAKYPTVLGVPVVLARLEDRIFEGLAKDAAMLWPTRFLGAIKVGTDLEMVWPRFALWLLEAELGKYTVCAPVAALYRRWIAGQKPPVSEWVAARRAAADADAAYAAADAAYAAAAYADAAAYAAADADAADAAAYAAAAYADAAADADAARKAFWLRAADKLVELLKAAPVAKKPRGKR